MTGARAVLLLAALALLAGPPPASARGPRRTAPISEVALSQLPPEVRDTLGNARGPGPLPHRRDGVVFQNRERRLPPKPQGHYREYTVPAPGSRDRGPRRLILGRDGEAFYTADHYRTFVRVREGP